MIATVGSRWVASYPDYRFEMHCVLEYIIWLYMYPYINAHINKDTHTYMPNATSPPIQPVFRFPSRPYTYCGKCLLSGKVGLTTTKITVVRTWFILYYILHIAYITWYIFISTFTFRNINMMTNQHAGIDCILYHSTSFYFSPRFTYNTTYTHRSVMIW